MIIKQNAFTGEMYLTRRDTEFIGLPVGNAFSGAPFKQKLMPFGPLIGAFAAIGTAATVASTVTAVVGAVAMTAAYAGVAMTVVGLATGDKELMKIGGIVGLAGAGVGMMTGGIAAAASGGSFLEGMGGLGQAGIASSQAASMGGGTVAASTLSTQIGSSITPQVSNVAAGGAATQTAGLGSAGSSALNGSLSGGAVGMQNAGGVAVANAGAGAASQITGLGSVLPTAAEAASAGGSGLSASSGGFFADMFKGLSTTDKVILGTTALSGLKGIGKSDADELAEKQWNWTVAEKDRRTKNANSIPSIFKDNSVIDANNSNESSDAIKDGMPKSDAYENAYTVRIGGSDTKASQQYNKKQNNNKGGAL